MFSYINKNYLRLGCAVVVCLVSAAAWAQFRPIELPRRQPAPPAQPAPKAPQSPMPPTVPVQNNTEIPREPFRNPFDEVLVEYSGAQIADWMTSDLEGVSCQASPAITFPAGLELNHYEVKVDFTGTGEVKVSVAHAGSNDFNAILTNKNLRRPFQIAASGEKRQFSSSNKQETTAWILLTTSGDVQINRMAFSCLRGRGTIFGHTAGTFPFAGQNLPYRLLAPRQIDETKRYPLVLCVSGSGGVGNDNVKQVEPFYSLAGYLYTQFFNDDRFSCYSLAPQMRPQEDIPAPYWPQGELGKPTPNHPDLPLPNAEGWYTQATLALIEQLIHDPRYRIDPDRIYFTGYSYGGKACWEFLRATPDRFAAAICGAGWPVGGAYSNPTDAQKEAFRKEAEHFKHVPVRIFAGEQDQMRLGSKAADDILKQLGADSDYVEFPGRTHFTSPGLIWGDAKNIQWLFEQKK